MTYRFIKQVEIEVEADSIGKAIDFVNDIDDYEEVIAEGIEDVNSYLEDINGFRVHSLHTDYVGCSEPSTVKDESTAEKLFLDYLNSKDEDEDDSGSAENISPEALARSIIAQAFFEYLTDTRG